MAFRKPAGSSPIFTLAELRTLRANNQIRRATHRSTQFLHPRPSARSSNSPRQNRHAPGARSASIPDQTPDLRSTPVCRSAAPAEDLAEYGTRRRNRRSSSSRFEVANLKALRTQTGVRLVRLVDGDGVDAKGAVTLVAPFDKPYDFAVAKDKRTFADLLTPKDLAEIKTYADGIGPWKPSPARRRCSGLTASRKT